MMENIESSWNILMDINFKKILQSKYFNFFINFLLLKYLLWRIWKLISITLYDGEYWKLLKHFDGY